MTKKSGIKADWRRRPRPWARKREADRRSASVEVRLTPKERDDLRRAAERLGLSLSELCRRGILRMIVVGLADFQVGSAPGCPDPCELECELGLSDQLECELGLSDQAGK